MTATTHWDELSKPEQRLLIKLFGCGSTRREDPATVESLLDRGLIDETSGISKAGLFILTVAMREQQALLRSRVTGRQVIGYASPQASHR